MRRIVNKYVVENIYTLRNTVRLFSFIVSYFFSFLAKLFHIQPALWTHFCARTHTHIYSECILSVKLSDVWSCFAWFRSRARGDKPLHLTSHISYSTSEESSQRELENGETERRGLWAQWPIYFVHQNGLQYHTLLYTPAALLSDLGSDLSGFRVSDWGTLRSLVQSDPTSTEV